MSFSHLVQRLEGSCRLDSVEEVSAAVELLQESSQWFPGGSKQMKVLTIPCRVCQEERRGREYKYMYGKENLLYTLEALST